MLQENTPDIKKLAHITKIIIKPSSTILIINDIKKSVCAVDTKSYFHKRKGKS